MKEYSRQFQEFRHRPEDGIQGDCYRTAVACALNRPRGSVPHSHDNLSGAEAGAFIDAWLAGQGLTRIFMPVLGDDVREVANSLYPRGGGLPMLLTGAGPRDVNHVVVVHGVDDLWCPTLGSVPARVALTGPARSEETDERFFWAEWIVGVPT